VKRSSAWLPLALAANGMPTSSAAKSASAAAPARRPTMTGSSGRAASAPVRSSASPSNTPPAITASWVTCDGAQSAASAAATAIVARSRSGARLRVIDSTAWATTATAASRRPCNQSLPMKRLSAGAAKAKSTISSADGVVKPSHAAAMPP
jgi:hypothetical protein